MPLPESTAFDEFLDRRLGGEEVDATEFLRAHPELTEVERRRIRALSPRSPRASGSGTEPERGAATDARTRPLPHIDGYRLTSRLGAGGMGAVFLADDLKLGREVAIKIDGPDFLGTGEHAERFLREVRAAARLRHPNIVVVHSAGEQGDLRFMVMEHVAGSSYQDLMAEAAARGSRAPVNEILSHGIDIARALQCAHEAGIIHRDVKPSNIRITPDGRAVLLDFGLVREVGDVTLTRAGDFRGSPQYASPEQVRADHAGIDARTDVYSLAATLYEALTGVAPFRGETREQLFHGILECDPLPLRRLSPLIPRDLQTVILTSLEKEPGRRHPTAAAFASDLEATRDGRPVSVRPLSALGRLLRWTRRQPAKAALATALLVALPLVLFLGDFIVSNLPTIERAAAADNARRLAELLQDAYLEYGEGDPRVAQALFEQAMRSSPESLEAKAGFALCRVEQRDHDGAIAFLDALPDPQTSAFWADRIRASALPDDHPGARAIAARLKPPQDAFDHFVAGIVELQRYHRELLKRSDNDDRSPEFKRVAENAFQFLHQAVLASPSATGLYHFELGHAAWHARLHTEARRIAAAIEQLWPESSGRWFAIGRTLLSADREAACAALRKAAHPRPRSTHSVNTIVWFLALSGRGADDFNLAVTLGRENVARTPSSSRSHGYLGHALWVSGDVAGAITELETAVGLSPEDSFNHFLLAQIFLDKKDHASAIRASRESVRWGPKSGANWSILGVALLESGEVDEAVTSCEAALARDPDEPNTLCNLGRALRRTGDFVRALECLRRGHELGSKKPGWQHRSEAWVVDAERLVALEERLIDVRSGAGPSPSPKEFQNLALQVCLPKRLYAEATALFAKAIAQDPSLKARREPYYLRHAVTSALLAGLQEGADSPTDAGERAKLREQARAWFAAELSSLEKSISNNPERKESVSKLLNALKSDRKFARLNLGANTGLSAEEAAAWRALWETCDRLLAVE